MTGTELLEECCHVVSPLEIETNAGWNAGTRLARLLAPLYGVSDADLSHAISAAVQEYQTAQAAIPGNPDPLRFIRNKVAG